MKKIFILALTISFSLQAQFLDKTAPSEIELLINNTNNIAGLIKLARSAKKQSDFSTLIKTLEKAIKLKPHIPILQYQLAEAYSLNDDKTKAFNALIALQKQGLYFEIDKNEDFANIKEYPVFTYIKENLDANNIHFGEGKEVFNIDKSFSGLLFESIAYDQKNQSFLFGSLRDGSVIKITNDGAINVLIAATNGGKDGPWAITDLAVDAQNDTLWVASSAVSQFGKLTKDSNGLAGIFKYNLTTGKLIKSYLLPENKKPNLVSSVHLTNQGDLYFIEAIKNTVLKISKNSDEITSEFSSNDYSSLRSITADETGDFLYISDSEKGILVVDIVNEKVFAIPSNKNLTLIGITDLIYDDKGLIFIQSGIYPERVMRLALNDNKISVENVFPIESSNALVNSPSYGIVVDEVLYYIANSQAPKTNRYGGLMEGESWSNMSILATPKHYMEKSSLEYKSQLDSLRKQTGSK